jgi:phosphate transport system substrate-binding protein
MDSVHLVIATRLLNESEKAYFAKIKITPRIQQIATDALALMVNRQNPDTTISCQEILKVLTGEVTTWNELSPNNRTGKITLVFDNANSSTVSFALNLNGKKQLPPNAYALKTNVAVVDYVANHPGAIGIIGYSWISDYDDPLTKKLRHDARLLAISPCSGDSTSRYYKPYADNLVGRWYPFPRNVYVISREAYTGLGSGFSAFLGGEIGQRIIKKAGIPPYYKVEYNIELSSKPIKVE